MKTNTKVLTLGLVCCALTAAAMAQPSSCPIFVYSCFYDAGGGRLIEIPPVPAGATCSYNGGGCWACTASTNKCVPSGAANDTACGCHKQGGAAQCGQPINLANGNTDITQTDLTVPGLGGGLTLSRTWNSRLPAMQNSYPFMFGTGWRSNFEEKFILNATDGYLKYARGDGSVWSFGVADVKSSLTYLPAAPANATKTITTGDTYYTLTSEDGEKKLFDNNTGDLISITDRNGNTTQLTYDAANRLTTVTDPAGRHLNFVYASNTSTLVSSVTSDVGITLSYSYDPQGRLIQVTRPDNTTISYDYDAQSRITAVKDTDGKVLESHTYDVSNRGLTSSRALGVESLTVSYPQ